MNQQTTHSRVSDKLVPLGVLGAFLFALVGGVVYYVLWSLNIIAALSGIICVICAIKGYEIFARESSKTGIIAAVVVSTVVMILAWYYCYCTDMQAYYQGLFDAGKVDFVPSMGVCLQYGFLDLPANLGYVVDLILSLAMGGVGCWGYITYVLRRQEDIAARQAEQNRTMELARMQAEQARQAEQSARQTEQTERGESADDNT